MAGNWVETTVVQKAEMKAARRAVMMAVMMVDLTDSPRVALSVPSRAARKAARLV